jgi:hypothetical protein
MRIPPGKEFSTVTNKATLGYIEKLVIWACSLLAFSGGLNLNQRKRKTTLQECNRHINGRIHLPP